MSLFRKPKTKTLSEEHARPLDPSPSPAAAAGPVTAAPGAPLAPSPRGPVQGASQPRNRNQPRGRQGGQPRQGRSQGRPAQGQHPSPQPPGPAALPKPAPQIQRPPRPSPAARLTPFEEQIRYIFRSKDLREQALTHSSFAYENQGRGRDNELLEFLGDSVIGLITADYFYTTYRDTTEGELSKLKSSASSTVALAEFAKQIHLDKHIRLGRGEERSGGRRKSNILADVFEAVIGAIYLDGGFEAARFFFLPLIESTFQKVQTSGYTVDNYKSALQEYLQKEDLPSPSYKVVSCVGPDHDRVFTVEVCSGRTALARAKGPSRKTAEQRAAEAAIKSFMGRKIKSLTPETFIVEK
jgi:ribonuclease III